MHLSLVAVVALLVLGSQAGTAYCTYHIYSANEPLTRVACSDGAHGLIGWGYNTLQPMFPYVAAWDQLRWNDTKCGTCIALTFNRRTIYFTALDQCGRGIPGTDTHFDISREAFYEIFGDVGIQRGSMTAEWTIVQSSLCKGNKKDRVRYPWLRHLREQSPSLGIHK